MYASKGVGLAAIQAGVALRVIVADVGDGPEVYVNPVVVGKGGVVRPKREGCLSFPGLFKDIRRFNATNVEYTTLSGQKKTVQAKGLRAQTLQHEIEHLDGILLNDH